MSKKFWFHWRCFKCNRWHKDSLVGHIQCIGGTYQLFVKCDKCRKINKVQISACTTEPDYSDKEFLNKR